MKVTPPKLKLFEFVMHAKVAEELPLGQGRSRRTILAMNTYTPRASWTQPSTLDGCDMTSQKAHSLLFTYCSANGLLYALGFVLSRAVHS
jgi:hypothetical protein